MKEAVTEPLPWLLSIPAHYIPLLVVLIGFFGVWWTQRTTLKVKEKEFSLERQKLNQNHQNDLAIRRVEHEDELELHRLEIEKSQKDYLREKLELFAFSLSEHEAEIDDYLLFCGAKDLPHEARRQFVRESEFEGKHLVKCKLLCRLYFLDLHPLFEEFRGKEISWRHKILSLSEAHQGNAQEFSDTASKTSEYTQYHLALHGLNEALAMKAYVLNSYEHQD